MIAVACATSESDGNRSGRTGDQSGGGGAAAGGGNSQTGGSIDLGHGGGVVDAGQGGAGGPLRDPRTCEEAREHRTYLGCEYWPTPLANIANEVFDFAVVVANPGEEPADVTVTGQGETTRNVTVAAGALQTIYLPWVSDLKGDSLADAAEGGVCGTSDLSDSTVAKQGAYRLVSTRPVAAYQFNPLEFSAQGGPPGKQWSCVPGRVACDGSPSYECNSYSNDASLLLPTNALTGNYTLNTWGKDATRAVYFAVVATADSTSVAVELGPNARILAGDDIPAAGPGETFDFGLNAGDVAQIVAHDGADLSGTRVQSAKGESLFVLTGSPSTKIPNSQTGAADHIEELVLPDETLGQDYVVALPTLPDGTPGFHVVRLVGSVDGTELSYHPERPSDDVPTDIDAGEVIDLGLVKQNFQVRGNAPFSVSAYLPGSDLLDPDTTPLRRQGDPSQTQVVGVEQYRQRYIFLAPVDYQKSYVDIVAPEGIAVTIDGVELGDTYKNGSIAGEGQAGAKDFDVFRVLLGDGPQGDGTHRVTAEAPVGIQVVGYGRFTSYQYPGGLNLNLISDPPPRIEIK